MPARICLHCCRNVAHNSRGLCASCAVHHAAEYPILRRDSECARRADFINDRVEEYAAAVEAEKPIPWRRRTKE